MTALTILRDILGRATAGPWVRLHDNQTEVEIPIDGILPGGERIRLGWDHHKRSCECGQVWSEPADYAVALCDTRENGEGPDGPVRAANATAIVQSISLARVVVDPETVKQIGLMIDNRWNELETSDDIAQAVLECLASLVGEEGK